MNAEVIIVGGGIIGCAAAYNLAKNGVSVLVLEGSENIGNGGSTRNGGGVRQSGRDPRELPLVMYSIQHIWPQLSDMLDTNVEYYQEGNLRLGSTPQHQKILEGLADRAAACGVDVRMISGDEARRINPYLSDAVTCASWCPTDGHANPLMATMGYYKMARRLGAHFISGEKVVELRKIKGAARQVVTAMCMRVTRSSWRQAMRAVSLHRLWALMFPCSRCCWKRWSPRQSLRCSGRCWVLPQLISTVTRQSMARSSLA